MSGPCLCPRQPPQEALLPLTVGVLLRCPYAGDNYQTQLIPVLEAESLSFPSHTQRFSIFTFSFVDAGARRALRGPV